MRTIIDKKELVDSYPLIERTITLDNCMVIVEFELISDLDLCITLSNKYANRDGALVAIKVFIDKEKTSQNRATPSSAHFQKRALLSKKKLIEAIVNHTISLPNGGDGFEYKGDMNYLKQMLSEM